MKTSVLALLGIIFHFYFLANNQVVDCAALPPKDSKQVDDPWHTPIVDVLTCPNGAKPGDEFTLRGNDCASRCKCNKKGDYTCNGCERPSVVVEVKLFDSLSKLCPKGAKPGEKFTLPGKDVFGSDCNSSCKCEESGYSCAGCKGHPVFVLPEPIENPELKNLLDSAVKCPKGAKPGEQFTLPGKDLYGSDCETSCSCEESGYSCVGCERHPVFVRQETTEIPELKILPDSAPKCPKGAKPGEQFTLPGKDSYGSDCETSCSCEESGYSCVGCERHPVFVRQETTDIPELKKLPDSAPKCPKGAKPGEQFTLPGEDSYGSDCETSCLCQESGYSCIGCERLPVFVRQETTKIPELKNLPDSAPKCPKGAKPGEKFTLPGKDLYGSDCETSCNCEESGYSCVGCERHPIIVLEETTEIPELKNLPDSASKCPKGAKPGERFTLPGKDSYGSDCETSCSCEESGYSCVGCERHPVFVRQETTEIPELKNLLDSTPKCPKGAKSGEKFTLPGKDSNGSDCETSCSCEESGYSCVGCERHPVFVRQETTEIPKLKNLLDSTPKCPKGAKPGEKFTLPGKDSYGSDCETSCSCEESGYSCVGCERHPVFVRQETTEIPELKNLPDSAPKCPKGAKPGEKFTLPGKDSYGSDCETSCSCEESGYSCVGCERHPIFVRQETTEIPELTNLPDSAPKCPKGAKPGEKFTLPGKDSYGSDCETSCSCEESGYSCVGCERHPVFVRQETTEVPELKNLLDSTPKCPKGAKPGEKFTLPGKDSNGSDCETSCSCEESGYSCVGCERHPVFVRQETTEIPKLNNLLDSTPKCPKGAKPGEKFTLPGKDSYGSDCETSCSCEESGYSCVGCERHPVFVRQETTEIPELKNLPDSAPKCPKGAKPGEKFTLPGKDSYGSDCETSCSCEESGYSCVGCERHPVFVRQETTEVPELKNLLDSTPKCPKGAKPGEKFTLPGKDSNGSDCETSCTCEESGYSCVGCERHPVFVRQETKEISELKNLPDSAPKCPKGAKPGEQFTLPGKDLYGSDCETSCNCEESGYSCVGCERHPIIVRLETTEIPELKNLPDSASKCPKGAKPGERFTLPGKDSYGSDCETSCSCEESGYSCVGCERHPVFVRQETTEIPELKNLPDSAVKCPKGAKPGEKFTLPGKDSYGSDCETSCSCEESGYSCVGCERHPVVKVNE